MHKPLTLLASLLIFGAALSAQSEDALLFYLSADNGINADYSAGKATPNYMSAISITEDGKVGKALHCGDRQTLTYWAAENIYSKRGTLSFFWRSGTELYDIPFPLFRVGFADHTSWDMVWLRIDYNGHGFEGFVTDNNLVRVRVRKDLGRIPSKDEWFHIALSWDENTGIKMYLNGEKVAQRDTSVVLNTSLEQFGPHSRIISPYKVQSMYNMERGGDVDEIRIYSQMLSDAEIATLAKGEAPDVKYQENGTENAAVMKEWNHYYGFDGTTAPPYLADQNTTIRKVGILETYDLKRWYWKSNDGIRETTWPGVYNRSKIEGRTDYFVLPDWDCYSTSGWQVRFNMPQEKWNYLEVTGGAFGDIGVTADKNGNGSASISAKEKGTQKTFHKLADVYDGQTITFTNKVQETPIQEFDAFYVHEGEAPEGIARLTYTVTDFYNFNHPDLIEVEDYVKGRFTPEERNMLMALPGATPGRAAQQNAGGRRLPIAHIVIPADTRDLNINVPLSLERTPVPVQYRSGAYSWNLMRGGLDGILVELPALNLKSTRADGLIPMNIQVKDPIWKLRNMLDFSFSVKAGEERTLWLDLRDRILPEDKPLYITLAGSTPDFDAQMLKGARITLVFKPLEEAKEEHVADRFTQVRDTYAMTCEENSSSKRQTKYNQLEGDMRDLLRVDPNHKLGRTYWALFHGEQVAPDYVKPVAPKNVPEWAFLQTELMKEYRKLAEWYIDNRQIENGEFGGGLSDDSDLTNTFPAMHALGIIPDKIQESLHRMMEAIIDQGMMTNGISTIMTDGLHTYEEGMNALDQVNITEIGNPIQVERLMQSAKTIREYVMGINEAGHLHVRSDFYSATKMADKGIWVWSTNRTYFQTGPGMILGDMYGNKYARAYIIQYADGSLAHARTDTQGRVQLPEQLNFLTDEARSWGWNNSMPHMWYSWLWTGDSKYLKPVEDSGWRGTTGTKEQMVQRYRSTLKDLIVKEYINTEGSIWIDRVNFSPDALQVARLGAPAMNRLSHFVPSNTVSWRFANDEDAENVAILMSGQTREAFDLEFFNTTSKPVKATMTGMQIYGGVWEYTHDGKTEKVDFGRARSITLTIPAGKEYHISMRHTGPKIDYNEYTDLAICTSDVKIESGKLTVTVHNLSGKDSAPSSIALVNSKGKTIATAEIPSIPAPNDLVPKTTTVSIPLTAPVSGCRLQIDPNNSLQEIYKTNNSVQL